MSLLDMYNNWKFKPLQGAGADATPTNQSAGKVAVDYLPNDYQKEVKNRTPGDKVVTQATADDTTVGAFNTTSAFKHYSTLIKNTTLTLWKNRTIHLYNAQGANYTDKIKDTPGALYTTNQ